MRVNFYGPTGTQKKGLAQWILDELKAGRCVPGFTDVFFCPMLVDDLADIVLALLEAGTKGLYHVAGAERISKYEFARRIAQTFGFIPQQIQATSVSDAKLRAVRPRDTSLNTAKVCRELGRQMPDVTSGLQRFRLLREGEIERGLQSCLTGG